MTVTYPKSGLQDGVAFQQNGKPGTYPVQAWNDEIGTFQFASTLDEGSVIPFGAAVVQGNEEDGIRLPNAEDALAPGNVIPGTKASGTITISDVPTANDTVTVGSSTYTFKAEAAADGDVAIGATAAASAKNLADAINEAEESVTAEAVEGVVTITAASTGTAGNSIALATTGSDIAVSGATLSGGTADTEAQAANAVFAGVAVFNYYATTQANGFKKQDLDVNVAVKQKGYVTVLMSSLEGAVFGAFVGLDTSKPGYFKVAGEGDTVLGKINKVFPAYGTAEIELKEFI